jgi:hypothetical protein
VVRAGLLRVWKARVHDGSARSKGVLPFAAFPASEPTPIMAIIAFSAGECAGQALRIVQMTAGSDDDVCSACSASNGSLLFTACICPACDCSMVETRISPKRAVR